MIHCTLILEDTVLVATMPNAKAEGVGDTPLIPPNMLHVTCTDSLSGKSVQGYWTLQQWQAVMVLAIAGEEDMISASSPDLYEIAEKALIGFPSEVRPIP